MADMPVSNEALGHPESSTNKALETGAGMTQDLGPTKRIGAHLNAFHAYASEPGRYVEANHYCAHLNNGKTSLWYRPNFVSQAHACTPDVRQCVLYDGPGPNARLIGIEYMITPPLYETLPSSERRLWHSHVFEVKSGMLIMPRPTGVPSVAWEATENEEMEQVVTLYGKVYHLWQADRGDKLPLGEPQLMTSYTAEGQFDFETAVKDRDVRFGEDCARKREVRKYIQEPQVHEDADATWKKA